MNNDSVFRYSYSAKQNEEVQAIRSKYLPQPENKLDELKRLDQLVNNAGMAELIDCFEKLGNCSAKVSYEYTEEELQQIYEELDYQMLRLKERFSGKKAFSLREHCEKEK